ncbi:abortive phage infection protein [Arthrobacter sp. UCD-GKA]|nr:abortive phage infection protein [Arthrobacter sp. UCD-GKA]
MGNPNRPRGKAFSDVDRNLRAILYFTAISCGLAWLVAWPLWQGDGLFDTRFGVVALAMMFTPAVAALAMVFFIERPAAKFRSLGLWPLKPAGRLLMYLALALTVPVALILAALPVGAALGVYPADFTGFSAFKAILAAAGQGELPLHIETLVALQFVNVLIGALINLLPALGEELGWRGWLLPKLMPYGPVRAIVVSGIIWGTWHAPLVLLGYNYPLAPGWLGVFMMIGMCILVGAVFGWLRLRSASVWPAALAHGTFNAAAGFSMVFAAAGAPINTVNATILGWSGWIVPLLLVIVLVATKQFREGPAGGNRSGEFSAQPPAVG